MGFLVDQVITLKAAAMIMWWLHPDRSGDAPELDLWREVTKNQEKSTKILQKMRKTPYLRQSDNPANLTMKLRVFLREVQDTPLFQILIEVRGVFFRFLIGMLDQIEHRLL